MFVFLHGADDVTVTNVSCFLCCPLDGLLFFLLYYYLLNKNSTMKLIKKNKNIIKVGKDQRIILLPAPSTSVIIVTSKNCFTNRSKDVVHLAERRCNLNFLQTKLHNNRISAAAVTFLFWRSPPRDFVRMKLFYCGFNGFGQVEHLGANECSSQKIGTCLPMLIYQSETDRVLHVFLGWSRLIITTSKNIFLIIHSFHWFKQ